MSGAARGPTLLRREGPAAALFIAPALILLTLVFALPIVETIAYSFTNWRGGMRPAEPVGLANYVKALSSERVLQALTHNLVLLVVIPIEVMLAVCVASVLRERVYGYRLYRFLVFVPSIISITIVGYAWVFFLSPQGIVNELLRLVGLGHLARAWLADPALALPCVMLVLVWRDTGFAVILFYSRLLAVDESVYEAAALDRAKRRHRILFIDLPLLKGVITLFVALMSVWLFSFVFNYVYVMTGGGPGTASNVAELEIYRQGFAVSQMGYASAISVVLLCITLPIVAFQVVMQVRRARVA